MNVTVAHCRKKRINILQWTGTEEKIDVYQIRGRIRYTLMKQLSSDIWKWWTFRSWQTGNT